ncbi:MAG: MacB family efflux pump subunit [Alphaproteobacteria bacterium]|jgi:macrolide transport system ATP-binding/permease protein|nr:MacB family efflux pump subunit [Alphaproteobacteria bacterium]MBN9568062.1 MacB family efflux pump subunit [Alphaproteobacteria bacterium]OJU57020.1 MAG: macrolide ABC transporter permease/ATP-binding protein MacB [Alphaproteobacteria bacterium 62-8]
MTVREEFPQARTVEPLIALRDVSRVFETGGGEVTVRALDGITLDIFPGEFVAIMGQSGSGKTTLMNILGCLDRPSAGTYVYAGEDVSTLDADELAWLRREGFGFVFQSYNLIGSATAAENVELPAIYAGLSASERKARAQTLLTSLGLGERLNHRPNQLSGGQQQRVSIARALMNGGRTILADEPTGALDSRSGEEVMALLKKLASDGHTVILITHDKSVAAHAQRVISLKDGKIIADTGTVSEDDAKAAQEPLPPDHATASRWSATGLSEAMHMAFRALRANIFRTILTLLGIVIGVGSVVAMMAIGEGAKQQVIQQIGSMGTNLLLIRPGGTNMRGYNGAIATLVPADAEAIAKLPNVSSAVPEITGGATVRLGDIDYQTQIDATIPAYSAVRNWDVERGVFLDDADEASYAAVAVLGQTVVQNLLPHGGDPIGRYVLINNVPFQVIGVMTAKGANAGGMDADDVIFIPLNTGMLRIFGQNFVRSITVSVTDLSAMSAVEDQITTLLTARHNGQQDFRVRNMTELLDAITGAQNTLTLLLASVAAISLLVGGIGVMNIMLVSVTERTREIGIRMATGARMRDILQQFLAEATVVSGLGGVAGVLGGVGTALVIGAFGTPIAITGLPMLLAFTCAVATGLVFGFAPAMKAARLDPVVALASE